MWLWLARSPTLSSFCTLCVARQRARCEEKAETLVPAMIRSCVDGRGHVAFGREWVGVAVGVGRERGLGGAEGGIQCTVRRYPIGCGGVRGAGWAVPVFTGGALAVVVVGCRRYSARKVGARRAIENGPSGVLAERSSHAQLRAVPVYCTVVLHCIT